MLSDSQRLRPALLVLDLGLHGLDGIEVLRRIRKESEIPVLMVTALATARLERQPVVALQDAEVPT